MMISTEEAARLRLKLLKQKTLRHLRNAAYLLEKMRVEAHGLEATTGPGLRQGPYGSGAQAHKETGK